jgi:hypothetical protein
MCGILGSLCTVSRSLACAESFEFGLAGAGPGCVERGQYVSSLRNLR